MELTLLVQYSMLIKRTMEKGTLNHYLAYTCFQISNKEVTPRKVKTGRGLQRYSMHQYRWYYYTGSDVGGSGVYLKKAETLEGLKYTPMTKVFSSDNGGPPDNYWGPELQQDQQRMVYLLYSTRS
jgi:hypothetical protein